MDSVSYFADLCGWVTVEDYFIGGMVFLIGFNIFYSFAAAIIDIPWTYFRMKRREERCIVHHAGADSEPCHISDCPCKRFCKHYWPLSFRDRLTRLFSVFKKNNAPR